ncbi:MAG: cytosine deaminase [Spirochaetales bacterium]
MTYKEGNLRTMLDLLIRKASTVHRDEPVDIAVVDDRITDVQPVIDAEARTVINASGKLVTPPFVDSHFHLDSVWTGIPNESGTLKEGIDNWAEYKKTTLTVDDVYARARAYCRHAFAMGIQAIRSHVDICDEKLRGLEALVQLRKDIRSKVDVQLVAFPQDGYFRSPSSQALVDRAVEMGVDVVGGIPHHEPTAQLGAESVRALVELAADRGLLVDMHCDESDDPNSRHVESLAWETQRCRMQGRVNASHVTSMAVMDPFYVQRKLLPLMAEADLSLIANPLVNVYLGGHFHHPRHRAMAPIKDLMKSGILVGCAQDCNDDPWYPLGNADMLEVAKMGAHVGHMMGREQLPTMIDTVTYNPARIMHLEGYGLEAGCRANAVILDADSARGALRGSPRRATIIRDGRVQNS